jgi:hypothetical protein
MSAQLLTQPPDDEHLWIPPDALPGVTILYTPGRNDIDHDGRFGYLRRQRRQIVTIEIAHTMAGSGTETPQAFANQEMPEKATLAELASFTDGTLLQSLPLDIVGVGSFRGSLMGLTHESAEEAGDPNVKPWNPVHLRTKALLSAWLINNPLFAAGDRRWGMVRIRHQICRSPFASTAADGGLACHTMWDTHSVCVDGKNEWSKVNKSCPGWYRRGTQSRLQFPTGNITDIPLQPGNFRDYFEAVGRLLRDGSAPPPLRPFPPDQPITPTVHDQPTGDDMPTHRWAPKGFKNQFEMPGGMPVSPGDIGPSRNIELDPVDPYSLLPLTQDFHIQRLQAIIHRNGISAADIAGGEYFIREPSITLRPEEQAQYEKLGFTF